LFRARTFNSSPPSRKVKILERAKTIGDGPLASSGLRKTLPANFGPCNVVLHPFRMLSVDQRVKPVTMSGFKKIEFFDHTGSAWCYPPHRPFPTPCGVVSTSSHNSSTLGWIRLKWSRENLTQLQQVSWLNDSSGLDTLPRTERFENRLGQRRITYGWRRFSSHAQAACCFNSPGSKRAPFFQTDKTIAASRMTPPLRTPTMQRID
jgi:hypothetical protein